MENKYDVKMLEFEQILQLIDKVADTGVSEVFLDTDVYNIAIKNKKKVIEQAVIPQNVSVQQIQASRESQAGQGADGEKDSAAEGIFTVKSPIVGTFYASKEEGGEPLVKVGDTVKKDSIVAIIEAMKLMNEITAGADGVITEVFVENGQLVEYGQELMKIKFA